MEYNIVFKIVYSEYISQACLLKLIPGFQIRANFLGLAATPPEEISNTITNYLSIPNLPGNLPVYPYVVFAEEGLYLALSDSEIELPTKFSFYSGGKDYSFTFSTSEVTGALLKTPPELVDLGADWIPETFRIPPSMLTWRVMNISPYVFVAVRTCNLLCMHLITPLRSGATSEIDLEIRIEV